MANENAWLPLKVESPRDRAEDHPDLPNNPNAGGIGSIPDGQPASHADVSAMTNAAISLLEDMFNLPDLHFGDPANLTERCNAVFRFYTMG
jgi:hypothetical protein